MVGSSSGDVLPKHQDSKTRYKWMFESDNRPTKQLDALLRAIGTYIMEEIGDENERFLTPKNLATFFKIMGGNNDELIALFENHTHESISSIWQATGCQYTLVSPNGDNDTPPTMPALTLTGFSQWGSIHILLDPENHVPNLQYAIKNCNLKDTETGEVFPPDLPRNVFPWQPNVEINIWYRDCTSRLQMQTATHALKDSLDLERRDVKTQTTPKVVTTAPGHPFKSEVKSLPQNKDHISAELLRKAAGQDFERFKLLLERTDDDIQITPEIIIAALTNNWHGRKILNLLLKKKGDRIQITPEVLITAASKGNLFNAFELLLEKTGDDTQITPKLLAAAAAQLNSFKAFKLLLEKTDDDTQITPEILIAAVSNNWHSMRFLELLLVRKGGRIEITPEVVIAAVRDTYNHQNTLELLLEKWGDKIQITPEIVIAAAGTQIKGFKLLLDKKGNEVQITSEVVIEAARNSLDGKKILELLLDKRGDEIHITPEVVEAAAGNSFRSFQLLLEKRGDEVQITPELVMVAAAANSVEAFELLLEKRGDEIQVTPELAMVATMGNSVKAFELLLEKRGDELQVTRELVMVAAARNSVEAFELLLEKKVDEIQVTRELVILAAARKSVKAFELLLEKRGDEIQVTSELITAAAAVSAFRAFELLLEKKGDEVHITPEAVARAARNLSAGKEILHLLLRKMGDNIHITPEVVMAAAKNHSAGKEILDLLLERRGDDIQITPEVITAVVGNDWGGKQTLGLLLEKSGDEIQITPEVILDVIGNGQIGKNITRLLMERGGNIVQITPEVMGAAAQAGQSGREILKLLLEKSEGEIQITTEILRVTAQTGQSGREILKLVLERGEGEIQITTDMLRVAAQTGQSGKEILKLLLEKKDGEIRITPEIIRLAAVNFPGGEEILQLLLARIDGEIQITPEIMRVVAESPLHGNGILKLLLAKTGEIQITPEIIRVAAEDSWDSRGTLRLLLERDIKIHITPEIVEVAGSYVDGMTILTLLQAKMDGKVQITPSIVRAAAKRYPGGREILELLLAKMDAKVQITPGIVRAAAKEFPSGIRILKLLLAKIDGEIQITPDIIIAAVESKWMGNGVLKLLLEKMDGEVQITPDIVRAAAVNGGHGKEALELLLERDIGIQITPEMMVAGKGSTVVSQLLLQRGGDDIWITSGLGGTVGNRLSDVETCEIGLPQVDKAENWHPNITPDQHQHDDGQSSSDHESLQSEASYHQNMKKPQHTRPDNHQAEQHSGSKADETVNYAFKLNRGSSPSSASNDTRSSRSASRSSLKSIYQRLKGSQIRYRKKRKRVTVQVSRSRKVARQNNKRVRQTTNSVSKYGTLNDIPAMQLQRCLAVVLCDLLQYRNLRFLWPQVVELAGEHAGKVLEQLIKEFGENLSRKAWTKLERQSSRFVQLQASDVSRKIIQILSPFRDHDTNLFVPDGRSFFEKAVNHEKDMGPKRLSEPRWQLVHDFIFVTEYSEDAGIAPITTLELDVRNWVLSAQPKPRWEPLAAASNMWQASSSHLKAFLTQSGGSDRSLILKHKCHCGRLISDRYVELEKGAFKELQSQLKGYGTRSRVSQDAESSPAVSSFQSFKPGLIQRTLQAIRSSWAAFSDNQASHIKNRDPSSRFACHSSPRTPMLNHSFLLLCLPFMRWGTKLQQDEMCGLTSDRKFFEYLRSCYFTARKRQVWPWARQLSAIDFVRFEVFINDFVDIQLKPSLPTEEHLDQYTFEPRVGLIPPIGPNVLMHYFEHPDHSDVVPTLFKRIPKKKNIKLSVDTTQRSSIGWGMHLVEGTNSSMIFFFGCLAFAAALIVAVAWSVVKSDVQGGFAIGGYVLAFLLFIGGFGKTTIQ